MWFEYTFNDIFTHHQRSILLLQACRINADMSSWWYKLRAYIIRCKNVAMCLLNQLLHLVQSFTSLWWRSMSFKRKLNRSSRSPRFTVRYTSNWYLGFEPHRFDSQSYIACINPIRLRVLLEIRISWSWNLKYRPVC